MIRRSPPYLLFGIAFAAFSSCGGGTGFLRDAYDGGDRGDADIFTPTGSGIVGVYSNPTSVSSGHTDGIAEFFRGDGGCAATVIGACRTDCVKKPGAFDSAGTVTVATSVRNFTLTPDGTSQYSPFADDANAFWSAGEKVNVTASGGTVPAFSTTLTAPELVTVSAPTAADVATLDRTKPLIVKWSGGGAARVTVFVNVSGGQSVVCDYPASAHMGTVPPSALNLLPAGAGSIGVRGSAEADVHAGDYDVLVTAGSDAVTPSGSPASFDVTVK